ncbi:MAG: HAD family phosphatase [Sedimentisphaerales bacterium]|nr:HAD family phosphatase [Sedimentisphaerales bacterium]
MLKAFIFDFDGVIADSEPCHYAATNEVLAQFGVKLAQEDYYTNYLGYTDYELFEAVRKEEKADYKDISIEQLTEQKAKVFEKLIKQGDCIIDGISEFIEKLKKEKIRIAVNSGASLADINIMLTGASFENSFDIIVSADDVTKGKPDPESYLLTLEKLNDISDLPISASQCVVIEDSRWGIISAKKAGMNVIAVTNSYPTEELKDAAIVVDSVREIDISQLHKLCSD